MTIKPTKTKTHIVYKTDKGIKVPGATTVTALYGANKGALIHWAWSLGDKGIDYRRYRDQKADIGTLAHAKIMGLLKNEQVDDSEFSKEEIDKADNCLFSYYEWTSKHTIEPILVEEQLVSSYYMYGGTPDLYCVCDGKKTLIDFKTGKSGIHNEYILQVVGYKKLLEEKKHEIEQVYILNIPRSEDKSFIFKAVSKKKLDIAWRMFLACLELYRGGKELKKE